MPGFIAMMSVFMVVGIEMFFAMKGAGHIHSSEFDTMAMENGDGYSNLSEHKHHHHSRKRSQRSVSFKRRPPDIRFPTTRSSENLIAGRSPSIANLTPRTDSHLYNSPSTVNTDTRDSVDGLEMDELDANQASGLLNGNTTHKISIDDIRESPLDPEAPVHPDRKALLQCLLLEAGILFHSIFIGMALSVTPAPGFYVLLVAISFHQTFEGLALGSRISALTFHHSSPHPWLMALAYGTTTPFGQAIGLAIHTMYDPASQTGLLSVGVMNAISSGLLLFAGLVELLAADFLSEESYETLRGKRRYQACASVVCGALLMALVGAWA
jgi:solute carrier family 39 (zinc transporter), member 1/2/3